MKPRSLLSFLALAACFAAAPATAQVVEGRAVHRETLQPVSGAVVVLVDAAGEGVATASTGEDGAFRLDAPGPGEYHLEAIRPGYRATYTRTVAVQAGEPVQVEVRMGMQPLAAADTVPVPAGLSGRVVDDHTGEPVAQARVTLLNGRERRLGSVQTGADGTFHFDIRSADNFILRAERVGYQGTESDRLPLNEDDSVQVQLRISTDAVVLAPLMVTAGPPVLLRDRQLAAFEWRRRSQPFGRYLTTADIRRMRGYKATDVLQQVHFVQVEGTLQRTVTLPKRGGTFMGPGRCVANVYIDGTAVRLGGGEYSIDNFVTGNLAAVEVYPSPAMAPGEFPAREDPFCGVVVIWTEVGGRG
jgi:Carboxypeptidase regulatory-like domain